MAEMTSTDTQAKRRVRYGLNVAVAALAAVALVVLINWIGYRQFVRFDFTATRQYSLSQQTRNLLAGLDKDFRIITLLSAEGAYVDQTSDLIDEYARYGKTVTVEHINPARQVGRVEALFESLKKRYGDQLSKLQDAIGKGKEALGQVRNDVTVQREQLSALLQDKSLPEGNVKKLTTEIARALGGFDGDVEKITKRIDEATDNPLPDLGQARTTLSNALTTLDENVFAVAIAQYEQLVNEESTPAAIKERLLKLNDMFNASRSRIEEALKVVRAAPAVEAYDNLRRNLSARNAIVILGPKGERVLDLGEMFREPDPHTLEPGQQPELRFQGEEKITGVLIAMSLERKPMVVFTSGGASDPLGPRGQYERVAQRLRDVDFQVEQWSPAPRQGPGGRFIPPSPPPEPQPGQKAVWIVLPSQGADPSNPMASMGEQQMFNTVRDRLGKGDAAMFMVTASPLGGLGGTNPVNTILQSWGIKPQLDRIILKTVTLPNRQQRPTSQIDVSQWSDQLPITKAIGSMPGMFVQVSPIELDAESAKDVTLWPLVTVQGQGLWASTEFTQFPNVEYDAKTAADAFVVAAAAQKKEQRLIVVADPAWATDQITGYGPLGPGSADILGAAFPANAELFINSVYWLAGLDELIAASPRTQDIRRVRPDMSRAGLNTLRWSLATVMPLAVVAAGIGVWLVRRRG